MIMRNRKTFKDLHERAAAGKAFIVYLGTGSVIAAVVAYLAFNGMGC